MNTFIFAALCIAQAPLEAPKSVDPNVTVKLVAREPQIVTPVGVTVDDAGRVIVVESHTHFRPEGYDGPPADRLRQFEDKDGDGTYETVTTLAEGGTATMNVQLDRDGSLLVANRSELYRLKRDDQGRVVGRETLAKLVTEGNYPHNGLSGLAIDLDGSIYLGMGENMGIAYTLEGSDGAKLSGHGDGGHIFKLARDGSKLQRFATGFWNPFELELDDYGRLYAIDNDPDSSPPCRLLFVIEGGDYGYRWRNGRRGLHPFTSWNGELPGTLPMAGGTGEAPSGLVMPSSVGMPEILRGRLLSTSWGEHRIYRHPMIQTGTAVFAKREPFIEGPVTFRPVGLAQGPDGSLFASDWVDRDYNLHKKGRVWHIRWKNAGGGDTPKSAADRMRSADRRVRERAALELAGTDASRSSLRDAMSNARETPVTRALALRVLAATGEPAETFRKAVADASPEVRALAVRLGALDDTALLKLAADTQFPEAQAEAIRRVRSADVEPAIRAALKSGDSFLVQAATAGLANAFKLARLSELARDEDPAMRLAALLVLRGAHLDQGHDILTQALVDPDPLVRLASLQWVYEGNLRSYRDDVLKSLKVEPTSPRLAAALQVTLRKLEEGKDTTDRELPVVPIAARLALDESLPTSLRVYNLRGLPAESPELRSRMDALLASRDPGVRAEAVRLLAATARPEDQERLRKIAADTGVPAVVRAEAVPGLSANDPQSRAVLLQLTSDTIHVLRRQAARSLRGTALAAEERSALERGGLLSTVEPRWDTETLDAQAASALLAGPASPHEGRLVFFHPKGPGCSKCHQIENRGGRIGPDLTTFGQNAGPRRVLESILTPSEEIAPQFAAWQFVNKDGTIVIGQMIEDHGNEQVYADPDGKLGVIKLNELEERHALTTSIMPENLWQQMTRQELRDLIEFLVQPRTADGMVGKSSQNSP